MKKSAGFNLLRWFAILSPIAIGLIASGNAMLISTFLNNHLFQREASITRDFVQNILIFDGTLDYLANPAQSGLKEKFSASVRHLANMPDVLRANMYGTARIILWSTDDSLIGKQFASNEELDKALTGELVVSGGNIDREHDKEEHMGLDAKARFYVESYIPVVQPNGKVIGVVEIYKAPVALTRAIEEGRRQVALSAIVSAMLLYVILYGLVRRADHLIKEQRSRLMEAETMSVVGELTSAVAHNIRNPLSSIRSSAELLQAFPQEDASGHAADIMREVDRISARITELLRLSGQNAQHVERLDLQALLAECLLEHRQAFAGRHQSLQLDCACHEAFVHADRPLLLQVIISLLSNASEAMPKGGECRIHLSEADHRHWLVAVSDQGTGIGPETVAQIFRPFFTTKPKGLGLGLPLAKRIVERFGGMLTLGSVPGKGTTVRLLLPKA